MGDWRPLLGLTEAHRGTTTERVITRVVLDLVAAAHADDIAAANSAQ
jgi:hypothetical protein